MSLALIIGQGSSPVELKLAGWKVRRLHFPNQPSNLFPQLGLSKNLITISTGLVIDLTIRSSRLR